MPFFAGISADGSRAVFETTAGSSQADTNGRLDIYARDPNGTLQLISTGVRPGRAAFRRDERQR